MFLRGIKEEHPFQVLLPRQDKGDRLKVRVDKKQKCLVADRIALKTEHVDRISAQKHSETAHKGRGPFFVAHFVAARIKPHHVFDLRAADSPALEKFRAPENRMITPEPDQVF